MPVLIGRPEPGFGLILKAIESPFATTLLRAAVKLHRPVCGSVQAPGDESERAQAEGEGRRQCGGARSQRGRAARAIDVGEKGYRQADQGREYERNADRHDDDDDDDKRRGIQHYGFHSVERPGRPVRWRSCEQT